MFVAFCILLLFLSAWVLGHFNKEKEIEMGRYWREFRLSEQDLFDASLFIDMEREEMNNTCDFVSKYCPVDISEITEPTKEEEFFNAFLWN